MRTVSYRIGDLGKAVIHIGHVAENECTRVQIDAGEVYAEYPSAAASLTVQPPEGEAFPAVVTRDGNLVVWDVKDSALTEDGLGEIQLTFTQDEVVVKSCIGQIRVHRSIVGSGETPDPIEDFLAEAGAALTAIPETINTALQEAKDSGEFDGPAGPAGEDGAPGADGFSPVVSVSSISGGHSVSVTDAGGTETFNVMDGVDGQNGQPGADGAPGADGFSPSASVTKSGSTATIVITDKDGTTTAQISDGAGADVIDDTAGTGDTTVTWSADKLTSEKTDVLNAINGKYTKPNDGIPASDIASGVIPTVHNVPSGGSSGQVLGKASGTDYDVEWKTVSGGGTVDSALSPTSENPVQNKVITGVVNEISEVIVSKNLYDISSCNPADGKAYWEGSRNTAANYATTGKIPVEESTQYIFSAGSAAIKYVEFYSGETGSTFISKLTIDGAAFTTPENTTYISVMLFGASHTTDQYNSAMAVAELNEGATVQPYEPYGDYRIVPLNVIEDGDKLSGISDATAIQSQVNMYDKTLAIDSALVYENQINTGSSFAKYAFTGFIPVKPNTQYCLSRDPSTPIPFITKVWEYNSLRSYTGYIQDELSPYNADYSISFKTSATTYYIGVNMQLSSHTTQNFNDTINSIMLCYGTQRPFVYSAYSEETVILADSMSNAFFVNADCFKGKRWLALGTSITWYDSHKFNSGQHQGEICRGYVGNVARRKNGLIVKNGGIAGSTLANVDTDSLINRYQSISWASYDFVTIEYGVNDYGNDIAVGTASDAAGNTTFASCLKTIIEYAINQNKKLCIIICTEPDVRGDNTNNNDNTLKDYVDVTLAIAAQYRLPVCDWYYHSGINNMNRGNASYDYMTADGTHPNNDGHLRMGAMLNQVFDSLLC